MLNRVGNGKEKHREQSTPYEKRKGSENKIQREEKAVQPSSIMTESNLSASVIEALYRSGHFLPGLLRQQCVWLSCLLCFMPTVDYISDFVNAGSVSETQNIFFSISEIFFDNEE